MIDILKIEKDLKNIVKNGSLEIPPDIKFGHLSFNGLMIDKSIETKEKILQYLDSLDFIEKYEIISGFLNIFFKYNIKFQIEDLNIGNNEKYHIEYCSPNPTGDLHLGHCRNTIIGFCLVNMLKITNFNVISELYMNDQGNQMFQFIETLKYYQYNNNINDNNNPYKIYYKGEYVKEIAFDLKDLTIERNSVMNILMTKINNTLGKMRIKHDVITNESDLYKEMEEVKNILYEKNLLYLGKMDNQIATGDQLILKTSELGLKNDSTIQREDGTYTYYAFDLAYHYNKLKRGFINQICVLGEDHAGHISKLQIVLKKVFNIELRVLKYHMFHLIKGNEVIAMSKREGTILTINEILEKIDLDYLKWIILSHNNNKTIYFDIDNISINNPLFNFKYIYMRLNKLEINNKLENLQLDEIYRKCIFWPIIIRNSIKNLDTHKILQYTFDLCNDIKNILNNINNSVNNNDMYIFKKCLFIMNIAIKIMDIKI